MKILLVDDHPLFRGGLRFLLRSLDQNLELDEAGDCQEAIALADSQVYDLVLLDLHMPGLGGLDALAVVRESFSASAVVVVSAEHDPAIVRGAIDGGAMGFIPKSATPEVMIQALRLVLARGIYLPPAVLTAGPSAVSSTLPLKPSQNYEVQLKGLTPRQMEVLRCVIQGKPNKVIARELDIALGTVRAHVTMVLRALGASNRTEAVYVAAKLGLRLV